MSVIHHALQSTQSSASASAHHPFNPLSLTARRSRYWTGYALAAILLSLSLGLLLWPNPSENEIASPKASPTALPQTPSTPMAQEPATTLPLTGRASPTDNERQAIQPNTDISAVSPVIQQPTENVTKPQAAIVARAPIDTPAEGADRQSHHSTTKHTYVTDPIINTDASVATANRNPKPVLSVPSNDLNENAATDRPSEQAHAISGIRASINQWQQDVEVFLAKGEVEKAEATLKTWISLQPDNPQPRLWLARIYINNGIYRAAEPILQGLDSPDSLALMGVIYERTGREAQAVQVFEALYRRQPENYRWLLFWAINSENSGQLATALALYQTYMTRFSADDASLTAFVQQRLQRIKGQ